VAWDGPVMGIYGRSSPFGQKNSILGGFPNLIYSKKRPCKIPFMLRFWSASALEIEEC